MLNGQRRFRGEIAGVEGDVITLKMQGDDVDRFCGVSDARLVLTDKLIQRDLRRAKAAEAAEQKSLEEGKTS